MNEEGGCIVISVKAKNQITIFTSIDPEEVETKFEQTDEKFSWLIKSGTSATDFELTDRIATLISPKVVIKASAADDAATVISGGTMDIDTIFAQDITATGTITGAKLVGASITGNDLDISARNDSLIGTVYIRTANGEPLPVFDSNGSYKQLISEVRRYANNTRNYSKQAQYVSNTYGGVWLVEVDSLNSTNSWLSCYADPSVMDVNFKQTDIHGDLTVQGTINDCTIRGIDTVGGSFVYGGGIALDSSSNSQTWAAVHPSFVGSIKNDGTWYNYISVRHQNGQSDGYKYGMRFWSNLHSFGDLTWQQQVDSWGTAKVIVDNSNISKYLPTARPGTKGGAQMVSGSFTMNAIAAGKYGDKTYKFSSGTFSGTPSGVVCIRNESPGTSVSGNAARSVVLTGITTTSISVRAYNNSSSSWTPQIGYILIYRG